MSRILFITARPYYSWQGACHRIRHNLAALGALGYQIDLLTVHTGDLPAMPGVTTVPVPQFKFGKTRPENIVKTGFFTRLLIGIKALRLAKNNRYDLIHALDDCGMFALLAGRYSKTPFILELHSDQMPPGGAVFQR